MAGLIPQRPKSGKFDLRPEEMDGLSYYVLSGCARETAFLKFIRPDFIGSKATTAIKASVSQFFSAKPVKDYLAAYKDTIEELIGKKNIPIPHKTESESKTLEEKKARAKVKAIEFAMDLAENIDNASDPEFVFKMLDKVGILDAEFRDEGNVRRYLPTTCMACAYRIFCEDNTEDMCQYCRYHKFGEENGVHYDKTKMLVDVPEKDGTDIAEESEKE